MTATTASSRRPLIAPAPPRRAPSPGARATNDAPLAERELTALWLLGRVPPALLPWPLLRPGRAGRGPGPDVREALFLLPGGTPRSGAVEVHLRASDFVRHGHHRDPAYRDLALHLVWEDDLAAAPAADRRRPAAEHASPPSLPRTVAVGPALGRDPARLRALLRRGPRVREPCATRAARRGTAATVEQVRAEGRRRLAERTWRASELAAEQGWDGAWEWLLERALRSSAGRQAKRPAGASRPAPDRGAWRALAAAARRGRPGPVVEALRAADGPVPQPLGRGRAAEVGWNAALPLLAALAAAYGDTALARGTAALADRWPAPRPYGRTRALASLLLGGLLGEPLAGESVPPRGAGALWAQGLLRVQELWCERGGCGVCPLSTPLSARPTTLLSTES